MAVLPSTLSTQAWTAVFATAGAALLMMIATFIWCCIRRRRRRRRSTKDDDVETPRRMSTQLCSSTPTPSKEDDDTPPSTPSSTTQTPALKVSPKHKNRISQMIITSLSPSSGGGSLLLSAVGGERVDSLTMEFRENAVAVSGGGGCGFVEPKLTGPPVRAVAGFRGKGADEVGVRVGDPLGIYHRFNDGWVYGMNWRSGLAGVFPGSVVPPS
ncbi:hypothetical protein HDU67_001333 [Dinochytrium kinnereticum]|nr:hypothetical protein HDU67_001333 [Dinochytrium kinnereticum]